ncbi:hypothetical protein EZJ43_00210 [Pedobacter changchengzhani]|uniref:Uncharacterized protein n=1 Tax=Pedobacter changchengzhani TaxID=2529274 RepID=A0A4R5MQ99_9SPHI|nr:hypothetical protein [Pedobacter changchengzhani]TDG37555.1 hypothetical protein EZJ43_00210 [Pedobacter changchengzhani]
MIRKGAIMIRMFLKVVCIDGEGFCFLATTAIYSHHKAFLKFKNFNENLNEVIHLFSIEQ